MLDRLLKKKKKRTNELVQMRCIVDNWEVEELIHIPNLLMISNKEHFFQIPRQFSSAVINRNLS